MITIGMLIAANLGWSAVPGWIDSSDSSYYGGREWPTWAIFPQEDYRPVWRWTKGRDHVEYGPRGTESLPLEMPLPVRTEVRETSNRLVAEFRRRAGS